MDGLKGGGFVGCPVPGIVFWIERDQYSRVEDGVPAVLIVVRKQSQDIRFMSGKNFQCRPLLFFYRYPEKRLSGVFMVFQGLCVHIRF